ncbi:hypothetical protein AC579_9288 [Pseudocercospora musae]|uniref:Uncharacterized protein n=1 Tax=Pseudocercospora musae TaxID=113226 RepID=A0A139HEQ8_9PEZI|nr:hypothetical protein AC579_9288 [Pseudocercospora musae]
MYRSHPPPTDPVEVEAIFASIDEKIKESTANNIAEFDALPREQRRSYLSYVHVKVIVDLNAEIGAKERVLRMVETDLATQEQQ